jgi:parallel beta-helix repeat protein
MSLQSAFLGLILFYTLIVFTEFGTIKASQMIHVPNDFSSIQTAINNASPGDTVFVHQGIYYENVLVNKSVSLVGENKQATIIDGNSLGSVITVTVNNVEISGFTLQNTGGGWPSSGIRVLNSYVHTFSDNIIVDTHIGILMDSSGGILLDGNNVASNHYGIYLVKSWQNEISHNDILHNWAGVVFVSSYDNILEGNLIENNDNVGLYVSSSYDNSIYYNNFVNNAYQASVYPEGYSNNWDAGYPRGGNFWSYYNVPDVYSGPHQNKTGSDGIGDFPYVIDDDNIDKYPHIEEIVVFHDVSVKSVTLSASKIYEGQILEIYVIVKNTGNYTESFSVTTYYDTTIIDVDVVTDLEAGAESSIITLWDTTGVEADRMYAISAEASEVSRERSTGDNLLIGGIVIVRSYAALLVRLDAVTATNQSGFPVTSFRTKAMGYFKVVVNNTSFDSEVVLITVNAFDASSATLGVVSFKGTVMPGLSTFILGLPIPPTSGTGSAIVYANAFTDWPYLGGLPCCPEVSDTFQIIP